MQLERCTLDSGALPEYVAGRFPGMEGAMRLIDIARSRVVVVGSALALPLLARADGTDSTAAFTTALSTATTAVGTFGAGLVTLSVVGVGFMIAMKYVKKLRGAA